MGYLMRRNDSSLMEAIRFILFNNTLSAPISQSEMALNGNITLADEFDKYDSELVLRPEMTLLQSLIV